MLKRPSSARAEFAFWRQVSWLGRGRGSVTPPEVECLRPVWPVGCSGDRRRGDRVDTLIAILLDLLLATWTTSLYASLKAVARTEGR